MHTVYEFMRLNDPGTDDTELHSVSAVTLRVFSGAVVISLVKLKQNLLFSIKDPTNPK
jgi:hypothetical protein